ncbi:Kelch repeat-containing protein [Oleiharenicola lentus]|uniref:Kelch repeat-containing protein n=1 Tax=Oleiharenicola lentus TaxID=2508720 RepID=UPI003F6763F4
MTFLRLLRLSSLLLIVLPALGAIEVSRLPDLPQSRAAHTLTALPDGRILIVGGFSGADRTPIGATLYSSQTRTFQPAAPMRESRYGHTATLLPDGSVLIAGGWNARGEYLTSAERFELASGKFVSLPALHTARAGHVAIALTDGRVLLAGGVSTGWKFLASAEIFDSATGRFSRTGDLAVPRENHAAVRLDDGRVLITGGHAGRGATVRIHATAEIFDPTRGTFTPARAMHSRRHKHDAVLLADGRVLITGGTDERDEAGRYDTSEIYSPVTASFASGPRLNQKRYKHFGTSIRLPSGDVLVLGGAAVPERFDPAANRFELLASHNFANSESYAAAALATNGHILFCGGYNDQILASCAAWLIQP